MRSCHMKLQDTKQHLSNPALVVGSSLGDTILLIIALCAHSVFEGLAIGVTETKEDAWKALWTICLHKIFAAIAMVAKIFSGLIYMECVYADKFNELDATGGPIAKVYKPKLTVVRKLLSSKSGVEIPAINVRQFIATLIFLKGFGGILFVFGSRFGSLLLVRARSLSFGMKTSWKESFSVILGSDQVKSGKPSPYFPIGIAIEILIDATAQGRVADWTFAISMGLACGVFIYVSINHLLSKGYVPHNPTRVDSAYLKFLAVLLGVGVISVVMAWDT
ncbi:hypothetical protein RIF29_02009 [Crotalaria pallida]|uniref:Uncharacterized protein n=1 Tax=Crotalaria pallida TaxID=3830 RepID=A0AAN9IY55_CROPI